MTHPDQRLTTPSGTVGARPAVPKRFNAKMHHRRSIRLKGYDYSQEGAYFITVCTYNRRCVLGSITNGEMKPSGLGELVWSAWRDLPNHHDHIDVDAFVVMPNHVHGIVVIGNAGTAGRAPTGTRTTFGKPRPATLATIMRSFKAAVTRQANRSLKTPGATLWQRNYYDRVIRNEKEWDALRQYIFDNLANWAADAENPGRASDTAGCHDPSL